MENHSSAIKISQICSEASQCTEIKSKNNFHKNTKKICSTSIYLNLRFCNITINFIFLDFDNISVLINDEAPINIVWRLVSHELQLKTLIVSNS